MSEYETMAGKIFGKLRKWNAMWNPLTERSKFSADDLKGAIRDVIRRRAEGSYCSPEVKNVAFKTDFETCRGYVASGIRVNIVTGLLTADVGHQACSFD